MKTKNLLPIFAASAALLSPNAVQAGSGEAVAAIGGLIGGMIIGSQIGSTHTHTTETVVVEHTTTVPVETTEVVTEGVPTGPTTTTTTTTVTRNGVPGYWEERPVQTWVPARWVTTYDRFGYPIRRYEPGYYQTHVERVWVSSGVPVVVAPTVALDPGPYYYSTAPSVHIGVGIGHHRYRGYPSHHYRPHYPSHYRPPSHHYRRPHVPPHARPHVAKHLNHGRHTGGLKPKFK